MCSGSKNKGGSDELAMSGDCGQFNKQECFAPNFALLLELSAADDLVSFKRAVEEEGRDVHEMGLWYGRRIGSKKMGYVERTPLMIASLFGSIRVLSYILEQGGVDVNKACGSDGATALHCAVAGGSPASLEVVKLLIDSSADVNCLDVSGRRPLDLIIPVNSSSPTFRRRMLEEMLKGCSFDEEPFQIIEQRDLQEAEEQQVQTPRVSKDGTEKKEYPVDPSLPDIKNGIYGTDEFRMFTFKVKPCSRAYSHDWTECPFVHPGENARRRDPRKYHYSCVPCPEFRKGSCQRGDSCEYAHGIFECWLHPAQYRTRLCKDESNCTRRVCFFAHKPEELRPLYPSTGSAVPSPRSFSASASPLDLASISPFTLGSPSVMIPSNSTPPLTPSGASSPMSGSMWPNQSNLAPVNLQLSSSRLKTATNARDMDFDAAILGLDHHVRQEQLIDDTSSPSSWNLPLAAGSSFAATAGDRHGDIGRHAGVKPTNLDDIFGNVDPSILTQLEGLSLDAAAAQLQSIKVQRRQVLSQQLRASYPASLSSPPARSSSPFGIETSGAAVLTARSAAFAKRSQSFIDRGAISRHAGMSPSISSASVMPSTLSDWGSPDGKLDWGIQKEELNKLRKSASFGIRISGNSFPTNGAAVAVGAAEPDVSWVQSLVKEGPTASPNQFGFDDQQHPKYNLNGMDSEILPAWIDQFYMEQEQIVA